MRQGVVRRRNSEITGEKKLLRWESGTGCRAVLLLPVRRVLGQKWCWRPPTALSERLPVPLTWKVKKKSNVSQSVTHQTN
jgi:hypothetical protein